MRQLMSSFIYFQHILVFLRRLAPFKFILPPQLRLKSSAMCTKLTMNFYIQLIFSQYSLNLLVSCITLSWNSFICFSSNTICNGKSVYWWVFILVLRSGEKIRLMVPLGLMMGYILTFQRDLLFRARISSSCVFLTLVSRSYFNSRMILSFSQLCFCSCLIYSCSTQTILDESPLF